MNIQEKKISISGSTGSIQGVLRTQKSDTLCVFVHGFTGHMNVRLMREGAKYIAEEGCDALRVNLYDSNNRSLFYSSLRQHIEDLNLILLKYKDRYSNIYIIGHSLGGVLIGLLEDYEKIDGLIFRDAGIVLSKRDKYFEFTNNGYKYHSHLGVYVSHSFYEEIQSVSASYPLDIDIPYLSICSSSLGYYDDWIVCDDASKNQHTCVVEGSSHGFEEWGKQEELFRLTGEWVKNNK